VVAAVGARLSPAEQQLIDDVATSSPEAYDRYLHALALYRANWSTPEELQLADSLLTEAIALDPDFALAYATRANAGIWQIDPAGKTPEIRERVRADIERALALQPDLPDALAARGLYLTYVALDPKQALVDLERALEAVPNDANAQTAAALTLRRLGRFDEAIEHFAQAAALSPTQLDPAFEHAATMVRIGRHTEAERALEAIIKRAPARPEPRFMLRLNRFLATGDTGGWKDEFLRLEPLFGELFPAAGPRALMLMCTEDLHGLLELLESIDADEAENFMGMDPDLSLALAYLLTGQADRAQPHLLAIAATVSEEDPLSVPSPHLAIALELLGQSEEAVRIADAAVQLRPVERDALNGPSIAMARAWVLIHSGIRAEEGYAELERLLGSIDLQPRWVAAGLPWMLLRDDERAQRIIRSRFPPAP
jgi:tetratricopeptide (TPR) repeat protein